MFQIIQGNSLDIMKTLPAQSIGAVFTSPPYNLQNYGGSKPNFHKKGKGTWKHGALQDGYASHTDNLPMEDYIDWQHETLRECWRLLDDTGVIFYNHKPRIVKKALQMPTDYIPPELLPHLRQIIIWDRGSGMNFNQAFFTPSHEWIMMIAKPDFKLSKAGGGSLDVWKVAYDRDNAHPAPFPVELVKKALRYTDADTVLDPFSGSGSTGVAALELGRKYIGIELDQGYCDSSITRLESVGRDWI